MSQNAISPTPNSNGPGAPEPCVQTAVLAPAVTTANGAPAKNLAELMLFCKIELAYIFPDPDDVPLVKKWNLLGEQADGAKDISKLVFQPKSCAENLMRLIQENQAKGACSCLAVICDAMSKRGPKNMLESLWERVETLVKFLGEEQSKLERVYFIFPEELVASCMDMLQKIGNLFAKTHRSDIYPARHAQEHAKATDATFTILILRLHEEDVVDSGVSADMRAHSDQGYASRGMSVDADGDCASIGLQESVKKTAKRKRDEQDALNSQ